MLVCAANGFAQSLPGPGLRYAWSDGSAGQQLQVQAAGHYTLRVPGDCGEQRASRAVAVQTCVEVPDIVTANADSNNDRFAVKGLSGPGWQLDVHTRWGQRVLHTGNYANDWGADAAPGPYYVLLQRPATGYHYEGWVEVVR